MHRIPFFALAVLLVVSAFAGRPATVRAEPPVFDEIFVDDEFVDEFWTDICGFTVWQRVEGFIKVSGTLDDAGHFLPRIERWVLTHTLIGPGGTLFWPDRGVNRYANFTSDGFVTVTATGMIERIVVPGVGLVRAELGRLIIHASFDLQTGEHVDLEVLWEAGPSPEEDQEAVCTALAG